jgi:hypothetical protein
MPPVSRSQFAYGIVRVVPRIERGESFNAGIVLFSRPLRFLAARVELDPAVLRALDAEADAAAVHAQLESIARIAAGEPGAGPIGRLEPAERFHWLVAPSSTVVQVSPVHTGLTDDPAATLERLFEALVRRRTA